MRMTGSGYRLGPACNDSRDESLYDHGGASSDTHLTGRDVIVLSNVK